jgi:hypothetical protein
MKVLSVLVSRRREGKKIRGDPALFSTIIMNIGILPASFSAICLIIALHDPEYPFLERFHGILFFRRHGFQEMHRQAVGQEKKSF